MKHYLQYENHDKLTSPRYTAASRKTKEMKPLCHMAHSTLNYQVLFLKKLTQGMAVYILERMVFHSPEYSPPNTVAWAGTDLCKLLCIT